MPTTVSAGSPIGSTVSRTISGAPATLQSMAQPDYITRLYKDVLGREPDPGGYEFYTSGARGTDKANLYEEFYNSPEAKQYRQTTGRSLPSTFQQYVDYMEPRSMLIPLASGSVYDFSTIPEYRNNPALLQEYIASDRTEAPRSFASSFAARNASPSVSPLSAVSSSVNPATAAENTAATTAANTATNTAANAAATTAATSTPSGSSFMGSLTQGAPLPDVTVTTTRADTAPDYYTGYLSNLAEAGKTGMQGGVAPLDVLQTTGYGQVEGAAGAYKPGLAEAEQTARSAAGGLDAARIRALMDPYRTNVVDEMARLQQQNIQRNVLPSLRAGFVGQGALGSQRYSGALGQAMADMQANLTGQQYGALSKGYSEAMRAALDEAQLQNEAAKTQMGLARGAQEMGLTGAGALTRAGAERQAFEQAKIDAALKNAVTAAGLLRGYQIPTTQTEKRVGPMAGAYQMSPLQTATGLIGILGSAAAGRAGDRMMGALKNLKGMLPSDIGNLFSGNILDTSTVYGGTDQTDYGTEMGNPYGPIGGP